MTTVPAMTTMTAMPPLPAAIAVAPSTAATAVSAATTAVAVAALLAPKFLAHSQVSCKGFVEPVLKTLSPFPECSIGQAAVVSTTAAFWPPRAEVHTKTCFSAASRDAAAPACRSAGGRPPCNRAGSR